MTVLRFYAAYFMLAGLFFMVPPWFAIGWPGVIACALLAAGCISLGVFLLSVDRKGRLRR